MFWDLTSNICFLGISDDRFPIRVPADGNCFFHAMSMAAVGNTSLATEIRLRVGMEMV